MKPSRHLAPISLAAAVILFVATLPYVDIFIFALLNAFAEASMVGGLADWFAVVALFRHPLGIPIPHTAILPRQRAKLTAGIIDMVQNTWLAKDVIRERIQRWQMVPVLLRAAEHPTTRASLRRIIARLLGGRSNLLRPSEAADFIARLVRDHLSAADLMTMLQRVAREGVAQDVHHRLLLNVLPGLSDWLQTGQVRDLLTGNLRTISDNYATSPLRRAGKWMAERSSLLDYRELADSIVNTLRDAIEDVRSNPSHSLRLSFDTMVRDYVAHLEEDDSLKRMMEELRENVLTSSGYSDTLARLVQRFDAWLVEDLSREESTVIGYLFQIIDQYLERLKDDQDMAHRLETWLQERIIRFVEANHDEIGAVVGQNLDRLNNDQLVRQIEAKVGHDLQYIRLNGAIVGGLVGAGLFLIKYALM